MVGDNLAQRLLEGGEVLGGRAHQREGEVAVKGAQIVNVEKQAPLLRMVRASSARARAAARPTMGLGRRRAAGDATDPGTQEGGVPLTSPCVRRTAPPVAPRTPHASNNRQAPVSDVRSVRSVRVVSCLCALPSRSSARSLRAK